MTHKISIIQARNLALRQQGLLNSKLVGKGKKAALETIKALGYVQIDTISVIERAHNHTLWNRVKDYQSLWLDELQQDRKIFEHWAHALAYLPMSDYRYSKPLMEKIARGEKHWYPRQPKEMKRVLNRITAEGPLRTDDFEGPKKKNHKNHAAWGNAKPAKIALLQLFMEGELMVSRRDKFQKVYDLTERVLPGNLDQSTPSPDEYTRWLITRFLMANGLGKAEEIAYLRKGALPPVRRVLKELVEEGCIEQFQLEADEKAEYYGATELLSDLHKRGPTGKLKLLSPFDNLVIQRRRLKALFHFDYQLECYVPKSKRVHGYFCLPILWRKNIVGRIDIKADKQNNTLIIQNLIMDKLTDYGDFSEALSNEIKKFSVFNQCENLLINQVTPGKLKPLLLNRLKIF